MEVVSKLTLSLPQVVAVDAVSSNLAFIRRSLLINGDTANVRLIHNAVR